VSEHPTQYALDRVALGAPAPADVAAHVGGCARCASELASRSAAEPPGWLDAVKVSPRAPERARRGWWRLVPLPALAVATAALVAVVLRVGPPRDANDATRPKGTPDVVVYVKRGEQVGAWDGRAPVRPGDRLRVGIRGSGYAHLSIASLASAGEPALLYAGPLAPTGETLLPLAFRVDARGGAEVLSVIASPEPVALAAHAEPPERVRGRGAWSVRLRLPKEMP
jgi:hypothetical protein